MYMLGSSKCVTLYCAIISLISNKKILSLQTLWTGHWRRKIYWKVSKYSHHCIPSKLRSYRLLLGDYVLTHIFI